MSKIIKIKLVEDKITNPIEAKKVEEEEESDEEEP
jgi:solute carrier family 8 (sodium/calcium exchanger)